MKQAIDIVEQRLLDINDKIAYSLECYREHKDSPSIANVYERELESLALYQMECRHILNLLRLNK